ncbi:ATP-binding protein [Deferribacterales bacterium RsTz2092]|nr:sensor histidine kinase [Deferribacterales bacterium]
MAKGRRSTGLNKKNYAVANLSQLKDDFNAFINASGQVEQTHTMIQSVTTLLGYVDGVKNELSYKSTLLDSVLNSARSAIIVFDSNENITLENNAGRRIRKKIGQERLKEIFKLALSSGGAVESEYENAFFRVSATPLISKDELEQGTVLVVDDISEIKALEIEAQRNENLQTMGEMAAQIAHDIRNPLGYMEISASLLERELTDNGHKKLTADIIKAIHIINNTVENTLLFTKDIRPRKQTHVLADIVDDVVLFLRHKLEERNISIINELDEEHLVECDKDLLRHIAMNLINNSIEAVPLCGEITLRSTATDKEIAFIVHDNGCGIKKNMRHKIFVPFQTTKAKGTGLGLSIVYKLARAHGGNVTVESDSNTWTSFKVTLPYSLNKHKKAR